MVFLNNLLGGGSKEFTKVENDQKFNFMLQQMQSNRWKITLIILLTFFFIIFGIVLSVMFKASIQESWKELLLLLLGAFVGNLNKVIDVTHYPIQQALTSNLLHRPIGIGVQGLADVFAMMDVAYDSVDARQINRLIFETIKTIQELENLIIEYRGDQNGVNAIRKCISIIEKNEGK